MTDQRDRAIESALARRQARPSLSPGPCLDVETLAAWTDGTLRGDERAAMEAHVSSCARCQALLGAMARSEPAVGTHQRWPLKWLVPITAAAAAVALWVAVAPDQKIVQRTVIVDRVQPAEPSTVVQQRSGKYAPPGAAKEEAKRDTTANTVRPAQPQPQAQPRLDAKVRQESEAAAGLRETVPAPPAADKAAVPETPRMRRNAFAKTALEISSPDGASTWRVAGADSIERSTDGGATWTPQSIGAPADVTTGASPSRDVVWLAGRAGVVLVSVDGSTWQRRSVGESIDLVDVRPADATTATVIAANGRQFTTRDGGATWSSTRLQEPPATPF